MYLTEGFYSNSDFTLSSFSEISFEYYIKQKGLVNNKIFKLISI